MTARILPFLFKRKPRPLETPPPPRRGWLAGNGLTISVKVNQPTEPKDPAPKA